jgi:hypothetical protein
MSYSNTDFRFAGLDKEVERIILNNPECLNGERSKRKSLLLKPVFIVVGK